MIDQIWANAVVRCCLKQGIDHFFVAPGSRCTPLTLAIARQKQNVKIIQHFDERGLAFATLGFGKGNGGPGVFVCTSGTAVANAFPAVIEASVEKIPMLLFTADRPAELRGTGANQTIDQMNIFGGYPDLFLNMPVPGDECSSVDPQGEKFLLKSLRRAFDAANIGPVHLNWMFREPFSIDRFEDQQDSFDGDVENFGTADLLNTEVFDPDSAPPIELTGNVLIVLGTCKPNEALHAIRLAKRLNCPMVSDVTSGLRIGSLELPLEFDLPKPDTILHLGGRVVSKKWLQWIDNINDEKTNFVHVTPTGQTFNPNGIKQSKFTMDFEQLAHNLVQTKTTDTFRRSWENAEKLRSEVVGRELAGSDRFSEPAIAYSVSRHCPTKNGLFVGNSMPIRDMDWFGTCDEKGIRFVAANRGVSGIDGLIATATGYAEGLNRPTTVLLGDLSTLHDLNSLALLAKSTQPMILIVVNNKGGHIFDLLPINRSDEFEQFFATPHDCQFEFGAKMFGIDYCQFTDLSEFEKNYLGALAEAKTVIFELITDRTTNMQVRQDIQEKIQLCSTQI